MTTPLEFQVLKAIVESDYQSNSEDPVDSPVWSIEEYEVDMKKGQLAGAVSSCVKKKLIGIDRDEGTMWITLRGWVAYQDKKLA